MNEKEVQTNEEAEAPEQENSSAAQDSNEGPSELDKALAEAAEMKDKYVRLYSEFENFRRRNAKERLELIQTATSDLVVKLLEVLDDFDRAQKSSKAIEESNKESLLQGFELVQHKLEKILKNQGLQKMEAHGKAFDADVHEAIAKIPAPSKKLKGKVVDVVEDGYLLNEKIIRFAKVVIGE